MRSYRLQYSASRLLYVMHRQVKNRIPCFSPVLHMVCNLSLHQTASQPQALAQLQPGVYSRALVLVTSSETIRRVHMPLLPATPWSVVHSVQAIAHSCKAKPITLLLALLQIRASGEPDASRILALRHRPSHNAGDGRFRFMQERQDHDKSRRICSTTEPLTHASSPVTQSYHRAKYSLMANRIIRPEAMPHLCAPALQ